MFYEETLHSISSRGQCFVNFFARQYSWPLEQNLSQALSESIIGHTDTLLQSEYHRSKWKCHRLKWEYHMPKWEHHSPKWEYISPEWEYHRPKWGHRSLKWEHHMLKWEYHMSKSEYHRPKWDHHSLKWEYHMPKWEHHRLECNYHRLKWEFFMAFCQVVSLAISCGRATLDIVWRSWFQLEQKYGELAVILLSEYFTRWNETHGSACASTRIVCRIWLHRQLLERRIFSMRAFHSNLTLHEES